MSVQKILERNFDVAVQVTFIETESRPESNYYFFAYKVRITNKSSEPAQLMSRHWIIADSFDQVEEVRGAGVVGQQPQIHPGQSFEYESACPLTTSSGTMKGSYQFQSESGEQFEVPIAEFYLIAPTALH